MQVLKWTLLIAIPLWWLSGCNSGSTASSYEISSPNGAIKMTAFLTQEGRPAYKVAFNGNTVIDSSGLGFEFEGMEPMEKGFVISNHAVRKIEDSFELPWGEQQTVDNPANELTLELKESGSLQRRLTLYFRAYDDGVAFRYEVPEQPNLTEVSITDELSEFALTGDHTVWWIPGDWDIYEHQYTKSAFSQIDITPYLSNTLLQSYIPANAVTTPVTMKSADGIYLSFHEADLTDYAGMTLGVDTANLMMNSALTGRARDNVKAELAVPFVTPWRMMLITDRAGDLVESTTILSLNDPRVVEDISWFKPMKYMGIWWEMHIGTHTWNIESGRHGATTERAKALIDYASQHDIGGILVEGWNTGWLDWTGKDRDTIFDFVTSYPDYDLPEVVRYGKEKGVELIMHHETSSAVTRYEQQLDTAFRLMNGLGIHAVKTGYVGTIIPKGEYHHGQFMVRHHQKVIEEAAKYDIAINAHEPIKATGIRRTYPNFISREGLRGQEFNAFGDDGGNYVTHMPTVAFTRMLAGPIDFTPGAFRRDYRPLGRNILHTTMGHEIGLYVVINSPIQMVCDLPEHIGDHPFMEFIDEVGVNWEQTQVLDGEVGDFIVVARQERGTNHWFVGAINAATAREVSVNLDFLPEGITYEAKIYMDGPEADFEGNLLDYAVNAQQVKKGEALTIKMARGGGFAISLLPVK